MCPPPPSQQKRKEPQPLSQCVFLKNTVSFSQVYVEAILRPELIHVEVGPQKSRRTPTVHEPIYNDSIIYWLPSHVAFPAMWIKKCKVNEVNEDISDSMTCDFFHHITPNDCWFDPGEGGNVVIWKHGERQQIKFHSIIVNVSWMHISPFTLSTPQPWKHSFQRHCRCNGINNCRMQTELGSSYQWLSWFVVPRQRAQLALTPELVAGKILEWRLASWFGQGKLNDDWSQGKI